jgi:predicted nucleotidyltransferase
MAIDLPHDNIVEFCRKWHVCELSLFGSVLRNDFKSDSDSDIDVLVALDPKAVCTLFDLDRMEKELQELFGRQVDLISRRGIEASRNYLRRNAILDSRKVVYAT